LLNASGYDTTYAVAAVDLPAEDLFPLFPIRDTIQSRNYAVVNGMLLLTNVVVFIVEIAQGEALNAFIMTYGLVPARYTNPALSELFSTGQQVFAFLSFMFLHGGMFHLIGNLWFLYIFGDNVEDRLGHVRYFFFYLLCGWASGLFHLFTNLDSQAPTIGASGAIAGVMGAYFLLYPRSRIITLIPILFIPYFVELPAPVFLGIWLFFQFISAALTDSAQATGIAWWAHIGGFLSGMLFLKLFLFVPESGASRAFRQATVKKVSPRFQMVEPSVPEDSSETHGIIRISHREALYGAGKLVTLRGRYGSRVYRVTIPPGIGDGDILRLRGAIGTGRDGPKQDAYLRVQISPESDR
jgi:membrane associated rhomboid family serine protease